MVRLENHRRGATVHRGSEPHQARRECGRQAHFANRNCPTHDPDGTKRGIKPNVFKKGYKYPGDPGRTRTCDPLLRRQMLYPAELRDQHCSMGCLACWHVNLKPQPQLDQAYNLTGRAAWPAHRGWRAAGQHPCLQSRANTGRPCVSGSKPLCAQSGNCQRRTCARAAAALTPSDDRQCHCARRRQLPLPYFQS